MKINLTQLRELAGRHTSRFPVTPLLDEIESLRVALEEIRDMDGIMGCETVDAALEALARHAERFEK